MPKKYTDKEVAAIKKQIATYARAKSGRRLTDVVGDLSCSTTKGKQLAREMLAAGELRQVGQGVGRTPIVTSARAA